MELLSQMSDNKFVLVLLQSKNYADVLYKVIGKVNKNKFNICYVCLSKPYADVIEELKNEKINYEHFIFIDVVSSLHYKLKPIKNCIFIPGPDNLEDLMKAVKKAINKYRCEAVIFDTISTLLVYQQTHSIVKFTHELIMDKNQETVNKIYVVLKEKGLYKDESRKLVNDLNLFADKIIDIKD
ncbi:hypothetical protein KY348_03480 [Candidatus Woesearchaeota archaeon]|nr:hypothetical protein [Candidatus Woesearchaeota archaeon]